MKPDAIVIFSGGVMPREDGGWRTTTYEEADAFGTIGGRDRVEATALLAHEYPEAPIVTTCQRMDQTLPTLATTYAEELESLGVPPERIIKEEVSINTGTSIQEVLHLAQKKGWRRLLFLSSEFQIPRMKAFFEHAQSDCEALFVSSESVLSKNDPTFAERFARVKESPAYQTRLAAEARGIEAIRSGTYHAASVEDKKERAA